MDLDELKQAWQQPGADDIKPIIPDFSFLKDRSYGPLAVLKRQYNKKLILLLVFLFVWIYDYIRYPDRLNNPLIWVLTIAIVLSIIYAALFLFVMDKMQNGSGLPVKENIEKNTALLRRYYRWARISKLIILSLLFILIELMMAFHIKPYITYWNTVFVGFRIIAYAMVFVLSYVMSRFIYQARFEKHLSYLENLLKQLN